MKVSNFLSIHMVSKELGITPQTLRNWDKEGKLKPAFQKDNGYRYYKREDIDALTNANKPKKVIGYCRVSSVKQKEDLERQVENVRLYMLAKGYQFEIITDIGSGVNYSKKGLQELIDKIVAGEVSKVVVLNKDRLLRFGYELLEYVSLKYGCGIEIIDTTEKTEQEELVEDLVQIITVFSCKLQGRRSKKTKNLIKELMSNDKDSED